jgi:hypothetical protein
MPSRILKETILTSRSLDLASEGAESLFFRLITVADDHGRFDAEPAVLLARCFPLKVGRWKPDRIEKLRNELVTIGAITLYMSRGALLGCFPAWLEHQRERTSKPKFRGPTDEGSTVVDLPQLAAIRGELPQVAARARGHARPASGCRMPRDESRESSSGVAPPPVAATRPTEVQTAPTRAAYAMAYEQRYDVPPTWNAKTNGMLSQFVKRVPEDDAPAIAAFYVGHRGALYVSSGHCVDLLLRDAEKLRTEWLTGRRINATQARRDEGTVANPFLALVAEERAAKS